MADADLDVVIRQLARQLHTGLMTRAKQRRDHFNGLAAKAKSKEAGARFRMMAKATLEQAGAAARRLQISADNVADSYARAMRLAASTPIAVKAEKPARETSETGKPAKKAATPKKANPKKGKAKKAKAAK
jgi:ribosomal protein S21